MSKQKPQHGGRRPGAGRKSTAHPEGKTERIAGSVPSALVAKLDAYAAAHGLNRSQAMTEAIRRLTRALQPTKHPSD